MAGDELDAGQQRTSAVMMMAGAGGVALGCFLPWVTITAPFVGTISKNGVQGPDGVFFLGLAAAVGVLAYGLYQSPVGRPARRWGLAALIIVLAVFTSLEVSDISQRISDATDDSDLIVASHGTGMWVVGAGVAASAFGWLRMPWPKPERQKAPPPEGEGPR